MKVVFTREAEDDLRQIAEYIARDSPKRAISFAAELVAKAKGVGRNPNAFQRIEHHARLGLRRRVHGPYLIVYRVDAAQVTILHVVHGARDLDRLLAGEA